jgi:NitT/TauT family transport system permease protein
VRNTLPPLIVALGLLAGWQALHQAVGSDLVSSPAETLVCLINLMGTARFWRDVGETGQAFVWALLISMALGITLGIVLGLNRISGDVIEPLLAAFYALPKVTLYPLVLLAFGLGMSAKVAFGVMHGLVPITLLTRNAIAQLNPVYWRSAKVMQLSTIAAVRRVVMPAIIPQLVGGIRIGFSLNLLGVLIGEMFASKRGLGFAAMNAMGLGDIKTILAIGTFLAVFAVAANTGLLSLERTMRHRATSR